MSPLIYPLAAGTYMDLTTAVNSHYLAVLTSHPGMVRPCKAIYTDGSSSYQCVKLAEDLKAAEMLIL